MKVKTIVFVALVLASCNATANELVSKKGSTDAERARAVEDCELEAAKKIPAAPRGGTAGPVSTPGLTECNEDGQCVTWGQGGIPPAATSEDPDSARRSRYKNQCLEKKGFTVLNRPDARH